MVSLTQARSAGVAAVRAVACWTTAARTASSFHSRWEIVIVSTLATQTMNVARTTRISWTRRLYQPPARSMTSLNECSSDTRSLSRFVPAASTASFRAMPTGLSSSGVPRSFSTALRARATRSRCCSSSAASSGGANVSSTVSANARGGM